MINCKEASDRRRDQYRIDIRKQQKQTLLKQKRKELTRKTNSLQELHGLLCADPGLATNKHFLQTLIDTLSDQVLPQQIKYLDLFMQMALAHTSDQKYLKIISLICFDKQDTQLYVRQICAVVLRNINLYRQDCLWLLTNLSSSSEQSVIDHINQTQINETLELLVQEKPLKDEQKVSIVKYYMNMAMGRPGHMLRHISILECMNQSSNPDIITPCCHSLQFLLNVSQDHILLQYVMMILRYCLMNPFDLAHINLFMNSLSIDIEAFRDNGIWQFIWLCLTNKSLKIRRKAIQMLSEAIELLSDDKLYQLNLSTMIKCLIKQLYQDYQLQMPILKLLQNAVQRQIFSDTLLHDQEWRMFLREYQITNSDVESGLRFLDVLLRLTKELREDAQLKSYVERICEDCVFNEQMLVESQKIMARLK